MIGDETAYAAVKRSEVNLILGTGSQGDVPLKVIVDEVREKYHLYFVIPGGASHGAAGPLRQGRPGPAALTRGRDRRMTAAPRAILVVDLAFGDCGKGTVVDFLTRRCGAHTVVRFNGGPQAGHNVVTSDGRHHTFSQFGSATFLPGVRTVLSRFMLIEPYALLNEAAHVRSVGVADALDRLLIHERC